MTTPERISKVRTIRDLEIIAEEDEGIRSLAIWWERRRELLAEEPVKQDRDALRVMEAREDLARGHGETGQGVINRRRALSTLIAITNRRPDLAHPGDADLQLP